MADPLLIPPIPFARPRQFARGEYLIEADAPAEAVYLLRRGQVRTFVLSADGRETVTAVLGPGHLVGISALLGRPSHHDFVQALSMVDTYLLPMAALRSNIADKRPLLGLILGATAQRLALERALLRNAVLLPGSQRLRDAAKRLPRTGHITSAALAGVLGLRPETLSRLSHRVDCLADDEPQLDIGLPSRPSIRPGRRTVPPGTQLVPVESDCIILIWSGCVRLFVGAGKRRELYIASLGGGDVLNLPGGMGSPPLDLRATAETPTVIEQLRPADFVSRLESNPGIAGAIARRLVQRVVELEERSRRARAASTVQVLAMRLQELAAPVEDQTPATCSAPPPPSPIWSEIPGRWRHADLAKEIGRTRESVTRALSELERGGYLRRQGRRLLVQRRLVSEDFDGEDSYHSLGAVMHSSNNRV